MDVIDLNINNYDLQDVLNLFNINMDFNEDDLKNCKKKVCMTHPDKSGLDKEYFLFFCKAYKIINSIYNFRNKAKINEEIKLNNKIEYLITDEDAGNEEIINNLKNTNKLDSQQFNKWFNELFEKINIENDYSSSGYGDWLKSNNEDYNETASNLENMNKLIEIKKEKLRETNLIKYNSVNEFNNNNYCDITNQRPEYYSSNIFSKLSFEDLKLAHEESVIPVNDKDFKQNYINIEDIRIQRQSQDINPLSENEYKKIISNKKNEENIINSNRAYKLFKQQEEMENISKKWWGSLKQLK
jgi:hypothetical protein